MGGATFLTEIAWLLDSNTLPGLKIAFGILTIALCVSFKPIFMIIFTFAHVFSLCWRKKSPSGYFALHNILFNMLVVAILHI